MNDSLRLALTDIRHAITHEGLFLPDKAREVLLARIDAFLAAAPAPMEPDAAVRELVEALESLVTGISNLDPTADYGSRYYTEVVFKQALRNADILIAKHKAVQL